jgi:hypothetical protein
MSKTKKKPLKKPLESRRPNGVESSNAARKPSALDAAARVLRGTRTAMTCKELVEAMAKKRYWSSPKGKTPAATLYSALLREITTKRKESRFKKSERGNFVLA